MPEPGLNYQIKVTGAAQGAAEVDKLAQATGKVATETGKAAPQTKSLAESLASLGSRNNNAKDVLEGVTTAARGGEGAIFGLLKAFKGLKDLLSGGIAALGPAGIFVVGVGVFIGLLPKLIEWLKPATRSFEEMEKAAKEAGDTLKAVNDVTLSSLKNQLSAAEKEAQNANAEFEALLKQAERLDNANKALELARVRSDPYLTAEQKKSAEQAISDRYEQRSADRALQGKENAKAVADRQVAEAQAAFDKARKENLNALDWLEKLGDFTSPENRAIAEERARGTGAAKKVAEDALKKAQEQQAAANRELAAEQQARPVEQAARAEDRRADLLGRQKEIGARKTAAGQRAQDAAAAGDFASQDQAAAEFRAAAQEEIALKKQLADLSTQSIQTMTEAVKASTAAQPPPLDLSPVTAGFGEYHAKNVATHQQTQRQLEALQRDLQRLAQQLAASRTSSSGQ